jgi:AcrR family transcriptional regulator
VEQPDPPWRLSPLHRTSRPRLSQDLVVRTGLDILAAEGIDAVTMRRVAHALETGPASLYAHVANKDELDELMLDRVLEDVPLPRPDPARWRDQLKDLLRGQVRAMIAHPGIAKVAWKIMIPIGPNALRHGEAILTLLRAGRLTARQAAYASDVLSLYTKAFAYEASVWTSGELNQVEIATRGRTMGEYLNSVPPGTFANMLQMSAMFTAETSSERFEFALDMLLSGITSTTGTTTTTDK